MPDDFADIFFSDEEPDELETLNTVTSDVSSGAAPKLIDEGPTEYRAHCEVCGAGIDWKGRGRKPKYCVDHKARTSANARGSTNVSSGKRSTKRDAELDLLTKNICREIAIVGKLASRSLPVFGVTAVKRANDAAEVCRFYAEKYPAVLDALNIVASIGPGIQLGEIFAELGTALMVDLNRIAPDAVIAQMLGVTATYMEVYPDTEADKTPQDTGTVFSSNGHRVVPQFVPVATAA